MDTLHLDNKFLDFKLFVLPETEKLAKENEVYRLFIVVDKEDYDEFTQELLEKIIGAMKLDFEEEVFVKIVEEGERINYNTIQSKALISFEVPMKQTGIHYPLKKYQLLQYNNGQFLLVDSLTKIATDRNLKGMLWNVLKNLLG